MVAISCSSLDSRSGDLCLPVPTGNFNQGWPKYVSHIAMKQPSSKTLALAMLAPCSISTDLGDGTVQVNVTTAYPWGETINVSISTPARMTLALRIPSWTTGATITIQPGSHGNFSNSITAANGTLHNVQAQAGKTSVRLHIPMNLQIQKRYNGASSFYYGPLLYSLNIGATETQLPYCTSKSLNDGSKSFCANATIVAERHGLELRNNTPWAWAIHTDVRPRFEQVAAQPAQPFPFATKASPVALHVSGEQILWGTEKGSAAAPPPSPVKSAGPAARTALRLIPYGSTHGLSMVELPTVA